MSSQKTSTLSIVFTINVLCYTLILSLCNCNTAENHGKSCPVKDGWYPRDLSNWNTKPTTEEAKDVPALLKRVQSLKNKGLTGVGIAFSFLKRRIQPLQERVNLGYEYEGNSDPSRMVPEELSDETVLMRLSRMFSGVNNKKPFIATEFC